MNGHCELFIYKNCKILRNKNFKVDDIQEYLSTLDTLNKIVSNSTVAIQGQWMQHALTLRYTIEFSQTDLPNFTLKGRGQEWTSYEDYFNYNYLVAQNIDQYTGLTPQPQKRPTTKVYYFITGKRWLSERAIELELEMDVINTLIDNQYDPNDDASYLQLSDKTTILRQHKNRWKKGTEPNKMYQPIVDLYSEGVSSQLFKIDEKNCYSTDFNTIDEQNYYLIYMASDEGQNKPVDIYLCADDTMIVNQDFTYWSGTFNARSELRTKYGAIIYGNDAVGSLTNVGCTIEFYCNEPSRNTRYEFTITNQNQAILILNNRVEWGTISGAGFTRISSVLNLTSSQAKNIKISGLAKMRVCPRDDVRYTTIVISGITDAYITALPVASEYAPSSLGDTDVIGIVDVDRTNGRIAKIVKLPYCPIDIEKDLNGKNKLPSDWEIDTWPLEVYTAKAIHYRFKNEPSCFVSQHYLESLNYDLESPYNVMAQRIINVFGDIISKNKVYETKLLHSDYYLSKFVYDSFSYDFKCEFMTDYESNEAMHIKMATTSSMTSNFFFEFDTYGMKFDVEDYSKIMCVSRNNEVILYNSSYLDYIRNGYNYDKKTRNRNLALSIASLSLGTAGDLVGMVAGAKEKTKAELVAGGIQLGLKTAGSIIKIASQTAQADQNIVQKLRASLYQGVSVAGSDDLDLLSEYATDNKPKLVLYKVSEKMEKAMFDLFYYTGYIANFQGLPDTTSRMWFNFVMAEPVYEEEQNFPQELLNALSEKYAEGITFLHKVIAYEDEEPVSKWDFEQQYENWEKDILPIPRLNSQTITSLELRREYVIKNDLSAMTSIASATTSGKLIWRKRKKSDLAVINEEKELDEFYIKGIAPKLMNVSSSLETTQLVSFEDYANADYYWTIEFEANPTLLNQNDLFSVLSGYIEYI